MSDFSLEELEDAVKTIWPEGDGPSITTKQPPEGLILSERSLGQAEYAKLRAEWQRQVEEGGHLKTIFLIEPLTFISLVPDYPPTPGDDA